MKKEVIFRAKYPFPENEIVLNTVNMPEKSEQVFFITINNESYGEAYSSAATALWQYVLNTLTEFDYEYEEVRQYFDNGSNWDKKYKKIIYRYLEIFNS